jgi:lipopolysaccharide assembly outer membrane protein LptD (OstA)
MKRLMLGIALLACLPVFAQDIRVPAPDFTMYHNDGRYRMEAFQQQLTLTSNNLQWIDRNACLLRFSGDVEVTTKGVTLQADEADYHCGTGEIAPRGNVVLKPFAQ